MLLLSLVMYICRVVVFFASRIAIILFLCLYMYFYRLAVNKSCSKRVEPPEPPPPLRVCQYLDPVGSRIVSQSFHDAEATPYAQTENTTVLSCQLAKYDRALVTAISRRKKNAL